MIFNMEYLNKNTVLKTSPYLVLFVLELFIEGRSGNLEISSFLSKKNNFSF